MQTRVARILIIFQLLYVQYTFFKNKLNKNIEAENA